MELAAVWLSVMKTILLEFGMEEQSSLTAAALLARAAISASYVLARGPNPRVPDRNSAPLW